MSRTLRENVQIYTYLGERYTTIDKNEDNEVQRKITAGLTAFAKRHDIFKGNMGYMLELTSLQLMRTSSNDIRRGNMGTHRPSKEQASSRTNKDGKEYVNHHTQAQKNKHLGKRKDKGHIRD